MKFLLCLRFSIQLFYLLDLSSKLVPVYPQNGGAFEWAPSQTNTVSLYLPINFIDSAVASVAWSPNSKCIAIGSGFFGQTEVWSQVIHHQIDFYSGNMKYVAALAWSPDGNRIASASTPDGIVNVWKVNQEGACSG